jgi:ABC-type transport system substrate-binding protein
MRSSLRARVARVLGAGALAAALILPAGAPAAAADPVVVRVGTTQDLDSMNPYATLLVVGYEAFQLNYNLLVEFGPDLEPIPGYADTWERAADGKSWTFHIPEGVTWSDGTPATSADACFSWQLALDAIADGGAGTLGAGYLDPGLDDAGVTKVECPDPTTMIAYTEDASDRILQTYLPIIPKHIWGKETHKTIGNAKFEVSPDKPLVGTGKTITGGGPSTKALLDPAFRDALGYAVDRKALVDKVLGGYGDQGNTIVPPVLSQWHVEPDRPRTFDIELAKQKLDAAGYQLDGSGKRLDKEGKPITLRMIMPNTSDTYTKAAQFVAAWYKELGIDVTTQVLDSATVGEKVLPPEAGEGYTADYDIELWGWGGNVDPNALLQIFKCDAIGSSSDSQYCNPEFDKLYDAQLAAKTAEERKAILTQMQNLIYDEAPYDILFYDSYLDAYRTDRFAGWQNQPLANGTPLLTYGILGYTLLTDASAQPSAAPSAEAPSAGASAGASAAPTPAPSGDGGSGSSTSDNTPLLIGIVVVVAVVVVGLVLARRRSSGKPDDDDE